MPFSTPINVTLPGAGLIALVFVYINVDVVKGVPSLIVLGVANGVVVELTVDRQSVLNTGLLPLIVTVYP